jgi:hypothetical protein
MSYTYLTEFNMSLDTAALVVSVLKLIDWDTVKAKLSSAAGLSPSELNETLRVMREKGLIKDSQHGSIVLTPKGQQLRNNLTLRPSAASPSEISLGEDSQAVDEKLDELINKLPA